MEGTEEVRLPSAKKYPKVLNINDEKYQIRLVKKIPGELKKDCGLCDGDAKVIWIRSTQSPLGLFRTLIHEVLHAVEYEHDIHLKHSQVYALEVALAALITDNL